MLTLGDSPTTKSTRSIEVFAERDDAERMLRDCLSDEPYRAAILEVVPVELEFSPN